MAFPEGMKLLKHFKKLVKNLDRVFPKTFEKGI